MTVAILGHGNVGGALARAFTTAGLKVVIGIPEGRESSLPDWIDQFGIEVLAAKTAIGDADAVVLAVPFSSVESLLVEFGQYLAGKVVVDCINPIGPGFTHGLESKLSGSQFIQSLLPESRVAKCFSIYGFENFEKPPTSATAPAMLIAADDPEAAEVASKLAASAGWHPVVVGGLSQALHLEHMTLLWIKMVRGQGLPPRTVWSMIQD